MTTTTLNDLSEKAAAGSALTRAEAERVLACPDLVQVGLLGEAARRARWADRLTYARVRVLDDAPWPAEIGDCGEVRLVISPRSLEEACERVSAARALAGEVTLSAFSAADLLRLVAGDHLALASAARALHAAGLDGVAELPIDELGDTENVIEVVRALEHGGLGAWRATVTAAPIDARLDLIDRAAEVQEATGMLRAFAPLPRLDPRDTPATGYDDVRTIAVARLVCAGIPTIQADWPLYGPKLAQVALAYGANDLDGVPVDDLLNLGTRRSPREEIERQIRDVPGTPVERTGRYEPRS
jgi:hypothetical protein